MDELHPPLSRSPGPPGAAAAMFAWAGGALFVFSLAYFLYAFFVRFGGNSPAGPVVPPALVNVALFSAFSLHHSLFARTPLKRWIRGVVVPVLERSVYTWIASGIFVAVCAAWQPVPGLLYRLDGPWWWAGATAQVAGIVLTALGSSAVEVLDLAGIRQVLLARSGRRAAHVPLITSGVYGFVRHPIYFGWALLVFGAPTMTATRFVFAVVSTAYLAIGIRWEERSLVDAFGAEYERYQRAVRWRMIPWVY